MRESAVRLEGGDVTETALDAELQVIDFDDRSKVHLTKLILPQIAARGEGRILLPRRCFDFTFGCGSIATWGTAGTLTCRACSHGLPPNHRKGSAMGILFNSIKTFDDLFVSVLQQIYYAERQIGEQLETMIGKATAPELRASFEQHLQETRNQYRRAEEAFRMFGKEPEEATCPAIDGILKAGNALAGDIDDKEVLDAGLTHAAQMVEHYEIAQYGTLIAWSKEMGRTDIASLLQQTLDEEYATDKKLTGLAEARINRKADMQSA
jgi:ferritin-like metal-binding protein YciE